MTIPENTTPTNQVDPPTSRPPEGMDMNVKPSTMYIVGISASILLILIAAYSAYHGITG